MQMSVEMNAMHFRLYDFAIFFIILHSNASLVWKWSTFLVVTIEFKINKHYVLSFD